MIRAAHLSVFWVLIGLVVGGCTDSPGDPAQAQTTYGVSVDAADAIPAPAAAAEPDAYRGRRVTVDGRITAVRENGCAVALNAGDEIPIVVEAVRSDDGSCAWHLLTGTDGIAVAAGTLRVGGDTLRLAANGVRVTPVRVSNPDS